MADFRSTGEILMQLFEDKGGELFQRLGKCPECGADQKRTAGIDPKTGESFDRVFCNCEFIEEVRAAKKIHDSIPEKKAQDFFKTYSTMSKKLETATMENYEIGNETQEKALEITQRFVSILLDDSLPMKENVLFSGTVGVGKSHLAAAACKEVIKRGKEAIFLTTPELLTFLKSTFNSNTDINEIELMKRIKEVDLLVLDDLGTENMTKWAESSIRSVLNQRQGKATFYTTNLTGAQLASHMDERTFDRLIADTVCHKVTGKSRRQRRELNF
jgi:DNA replication protein DnaC